MWYKWVFALFLAIIGISLFLSKGWEPASDNSDNNEKTSNILRSLHKVCMVEKDLDNNVLIAVCTDSAIQYSDNTVVFSRFDLSTDSGGHMQGEKGEYRMDQSLLKVLGPITIKTKDGDNAYIEGLTWDRKSNTMKTDSPVRIEAKKIVIEAKRAEFHDNPQVLSFLGGVHAKIYSDHFSN